ncbi:MAG: DUF1194 domain-containing protein [Acetobacteraceae bacterium]|nr:DUF1194 domain-containing protein [Acetobacteraceae bacterium]
MRRIGLLFLLASLLLPRVPLAGERNVDLALVLLTDVSRSVDAPEYALMKDGYAAALTDPRVLAAIAGGPQAAIAILYVEFAGAQEVRTLVEWSVVSDAATAAAFAARVQQAPRAFWGRTSISAGIDHAMAALLRDLDSAGIAADRLVIDVCGDGTNNSGREATAARDEAVAAGVTINALVIHSDPANAWIAAHVNPPGGLTAWFRDNVIGGLGPFVLEVEDFASFGHGMTRKLISEIASRRDVDLAAAARRGVRRAPATSR